MSDDVFGQPIDKPEADLFFEKFIRIKQRTTPVLQKELANDEEALRFYCGRPGNDPVLEDWAFVFDKAAMEHVMQKLHAGEADCVFIFHGAAADGKPTLMIIPAKYNEVDEAIPENQTFSKQAETNTFAAPGNEFVLFARGKGGVQHPGTGGGEIATIDAAKIELPEGFKQGLYH